MERLRFRSTTSMVDIMAELHERDLLDEARRVRDARRVSGRASAARLGLGIFRFRPRKG